MKFADTLAQLRRAKGLSQEQLAERMHVSRQAVSKWEAGQAMPDLARLVALADLFGVSLDALVRPQAACEPQDPAVRIVAAGRTLEVPAGVTVNVMPGYEYRSRRTLFGLPLVHINCGYGLRRACGIIAVGNVAYGAVAVGGLGVGAVSISGLGLGLLSFGGLAFGLFSFGGLAVGAVAVGGAAIGAYALGGAAVASHVAVGGSALAPVSVGANADAGLVITGETHAREIAAYLRQHCPDLWPPLLRLLSGMAG